MGQEWGRRGLARALQAAPNRTSPRRFVVETRSPKAGALIGPRLTVARHFVSAGPIPPSQTRRNGLCNPSS